MFLKNKPMKMKNNYLLSKTALFSLILLLASCAIPEPGITKNNRSIKEGIASRTIWFGMAFGTTDLSIPTAAKLGGITKVATVEQGIVPKLFRVTYFTKVTGE